MESFASNRLILERALITEVLLGEWLINLIVMRLSNFISKCHCFGWGKWEDFNRFFTGVIWAWHANSYITKIAMIVRTVIHVTSPHSLKPFFDEILSELNHRVRTRYPAIPSALLTVDFLAWVVEAGKAGESIRSTYFSECLNLRLFCLWVSMGPSVQH